MKRTLIIASFLLSVFDSSAQKTLARPKLVVGIMVDQMRWDYLYRYYSGYGDDGFKRLMHDGFNCQNTLINYLPSFTAPGHTCVYTGSVPAINGIVANDWIDNATDKPVYCTEDNSVTPVSGSGKAGKMSPRNLLSTTITDELRLATNMRSRVYGFAIKDRGSILPAGHLGNGAYWYDDSTGNFMSSSYYGNALPAWLSDFNAKRYADEYIKQDWELLYPLEYYTQSLADNNKYEGAYKGEPSPVFPHKYNASVTKGYGRLRAIPQGNTYTLRAAKSCIKGAGLGQGSDPDFLCVSLSTTDYVGHQFTPNAIETEDMYLRLDKDIASFLRYLDANVGKGNYTVFLTADHGAAHNPNYLKDINIPAGNRTEQSAYTDLNTYLKQKTGKDSVVKDLSNYQVYLNDDAIVKYKLNRAEVKNHVADWFNKQEGVAYVIDLENINEATIPEDVKTRVINGYNRLRSGCMQVILLPGWYSGYSPTGTTHGTWNPYDTHIPLLWYGWGIPKGDTHREVNMTDIAATLAALLHIQMPNGSVGKVITEITD